MAEINKDTANWRLYGGGGLLLGGLIWAVGVVLDLVGVAGVGGWLGVVGAALVGIGLLLVAFGQTGSNGAVGASLWGKLVLVVAALALLALALFALLGLVGTAVPALLGQIVLIVFVVAGLLAAVSIFGRGVAQGIAKWALFLPALWAILAVIVAFGTDLGGAWVTLVWAVLFLLTGLAYLFNKTGR